MCFWICIFFNTTVRKFSTDEHLLLLLGMVKGIFWVPILGTYLKWKQKRIRVNQFPYLKYSCTCVFLQNLYTSQIVLKYLWEWGQNKVVAFSFLLTSNPCFSEHIRLGGKQWCLFLIEKTTQMIFGGVSLFSTVFRPRFSFSLYPICLQTVNALTFYTPTGQTR